VDEDDPAKMKHAIYVLTMKLFADMERKKRSLEQRDMEERKRKREDEIDQEEKARLEKEWLKNYEVAITCINSSHKVLFTELIVFSADFRIQEKDV